MLAIDLCAAVPHLTLDDDDEEGVAVCTPLAFPCNVAVCPALPADIWQRIGELRPSVARRLAIIVPLELRVIAVLAIQRSWRQGYVVRPNMVRLPIWEPVFFGDDGRGMMLGPSRRSLCFVLEWLSVF